MTTVAPENAAQVPPLPAFKESGYALFFDVDGTLAELRPTPDDVSIPPTVLATLQALSDLCGGALALVSGRPIAQLDQLAAPLILPMAGVHGAEMRDAEGQLHRISLPEEVAAPLQVMLEAGMSALPGTLLEEKGMAFALHYRQAPALESQVLALAESAVSSFPQLMLQPGKCVVELKPQGVDKGAAIGSMMQQPPFAGRTPLFIGDDLTDEKGFAAVNAMQGITIKVGEGESQAHYRLNEVADVHLWLEKILLQLKQNTVSKGSRL